MSDYRRIFVGLFVAYEEKAHTHDRTYSRSCDSCGTTYPDKVACDGLCPRCQAEAEELAGRLLTTWEEASGSAEGVAQVRVRYEKAVRKRSSRLREEEKERRRRLPRRFDESG